MDKLTYNPLGETKATNDSAFIFALQEAEARMSDVLSRIVRVTDNLCGPVPESAATGGQLRSIPNGLLDTAAAHGHNISDMLDKANQCLSRIERALP